MFPHRDCQEFKPRILIVGDAIVDEWIVAEPDGTSQEGSPKYRFKERLLRPGGATNVARQLVNFNCEVELLSWFDTGAFSVFDCLTRCKVNLAELVISHKNRNPRKTRLWDGQRVVGRMDHDTYHDGPELQRCCDSINAAVLKRIDERAVDVLVLSDYGNGVLGFSNCLDYIKAANRASVPVIVDPKSLDPVSTKDASLIKCNQLYWMNEVFEGYRSCNYLVTNGPHSPVWHNEDVSIKLPKLPTVQNPCVVGAGDCFLAHLALAWGRGVRNIRAAEMANKASRNYVTRPFAEPLFPCEAEATKCVHLDDLLPVIAERCQGKKLIVTSGRFDLVHPRHAAFLRWAKAQGDYLVVLLNDDGGVRALKGEGRPIMPVKDRASVLEAFGAVDWVVPFAGTETLPALDKIRQARCASTRQLAFAKGHDYADKDIPEKAICEVLIAPDLGYAGHSSDLRR